MRPTPAKARPPTRRSPRRSPNNSTKSRSSRLKKSTAESPSKRRSIKRGRLEEQDSLGSPNFALTPVNRRKRVRTPDEDSTPAATADKIIMNTPTVTNENSSKSGSRSKMAYGRRARMSPRTHGAAIANSLASPAIDSSFLISNTAPITPSKRSTAESTLNHLARKARRGRNSTSQLLTYDNNSKATVKKIPKKKAPINNNLDSTVIPESLEHAKFVPKGKVEERWLKNFNKWKKSMEEQGLQGLEDDTAQKSPLPKSWINAQRREYRAMKQNEKSSMTQSKIHLLESAGFTWNAPMRRPKKSNSSNNTNEEASDITAPNKVVSKRLKRSNEQIKVSSKSSPSKRTSPRKSCPTQFYHNLSGNDEKTGDSKVSMNKVAKQKKDKPLKLREPKTSKPISNPKEDESEDDEKAVKSLILLSTSSSENDQCTKQKCGGKKRRSRGGRQAMSFLSSLETLQTSDASSKKKRAPGPTKANDTEMDATNSIMIEKSKGTKPKSVPKENENEQTNATGGQETIEGEKFSSDITAQTTEGEKFSSDITAQKNEDVDPLVSKADDITARDETLDHEAASTDDQLKSPFPSSQLTTSNLECPESGSVSVGHAKDSPAKKKVPESISIRELMMSCLTEEDKEEGKHNKSGSTRLRSADESESTHEDEGVEGGTKTNDPLRNLPNTPIQNKETSTATFSPLSMTSPLRANNLLETSYNVEPEVQDKTSTHQSRSDSPPDQPVKRRSRNSSRPSNVLVQNESRHVDVSTTTNAEIVTKTNERTDEAERLQLIQRERRYREKMTEFGKLELEAKLVTERMRQIEERMRQIESSSIANDLREYDEMKRRASYPEPKRLWKREMIESQRYQASDDEFSDMYESQRNWGHDGYQRHGDYGRSSTRSRIRSESHRSRSHSKRSSQSRRSNTQRRRLENSKIEDDRNRESAPRNEKRKKRRKNRARETGQDSMSQMDRTLLKSPYAELQNDDFRQQEARHPNQYSNANLHIEKNDLDANKETDIVATSSSEVEENTIPASSSSSAENESKKDLDSTSTKQSSIDQAEERNSSNDGNKTNTKDNAKDPLYWLAGGDSDSDAESWDLDGPMILPPPPA